MGALTRGDGAGARAEAPSGGCKTSRGTSVRRCITRIVTSSIAKVVRRATTARRCGVFRRGERVVSGRDDGGATVVFDQATTEEATGNSRRDRRVWRARAG